MLLTELYPHHHRRYSSLPILGSALEGYVDWLFRHSYPRHRVRQHLRTARRLDLLLYKHGARGPRDLTRELLCASAPASSYEDPDLAVVVRLLDRYLEWQGVFFPPPPTAVGLRIAAYRTYLEDVRGLAPSTVTQHAATAAEFLKHLGYEEHPAVLKALNGAHVEGFVREVGARLSRASMQHTVAHLRAFLRFLAVRGDAPPALDAQIDTPRVYRQEQLPRSLPWETVRALLRSIDRSDPLGMRDYAMLLLMATYGLRACDVVMLTLDNIEWKTERLSVPQRKTASSLSLPLTDEVGASLLAYLRRGRPRLPHREVFLRGRAPAGVLKPTAVTDAFQAWSRRSGLTIPFQGVHCLRHSYAVHLLRQGTSLKTIGDILGHRTAESTCAYLRLAVEDLRDVALPLPKTPAWEARP